MVRPEDVAAETWAIVGGRHPDEPGSTLNVPPQLASNFVLGSERIYTRNESTPGWEALEELVGGLEGGHAVAFSSGMGACAAVMNQLPTGARVVLGTDCYQGVAELAANGERQHGWKVERLAADDPAWLTKGQDVDLLWIESPSNPLLEVADVAGICAAPRKAGARVVVDNTFATPLGQQPLRLGADVVVHSATKFIGGHSDLLCGLAVTKDPAQLAQLRRARGVNGATPGALEAYLALRGARTLPLRLKQSSASAADLAQRLAGHPSVTKVRYPGFGGIVSFELADAAAADRACTAVHVIRHATSLGGVETTMERRNAHPGQEHIPPGLIRMSVGCEDVEDLWADLDRAL